MTFSFKISADRFGTVSDLQSICLDRIRLIIARTPLQIHIAYRSTTIDRQQIVRSRWGQSETCDVNAGASPMNIFYRGFKSIFAKKPPKGASKLRLSESRAFTIYFIRQSTMIQINLIEPEPNELFSVSA
jgi:hypothetical protein